MGSNFIQVSSPADPDIKLTIGVRWANEDVRIQRTGVPAGEIIPAGDVPFFWENISRGILVWQGRDEEVLYHNSTEIRVGDLTFTLGLSDFNWDYDATDLAVMDEETADKIVASFGFPQ